METFFTKGVGAYAGTITFEQMENNVISIYARDDAKDYILDNDGALIEISMADVGRLITWLKRVRNKEAGISGR